MVAAWRYLLLLILRGKWAYSWLLSSVPNLVMMRIQCLCALHGGCLHANHLLGFLHMVMLMVSGDVLLPSLLSRVVIGADASCAVRARHLWRWSAADASMFSNSWFAVCWPYLAWCAHIHSCWAPWHIVLQQSRWALRLRMLWGCGMIRTCRVIWSGCLWSRGCHFACWSIIGRLPLIRVGIFDRGHRNLRFLVAIVVSPWWLRGCAFIILAVIWRTNGILLVSCSWMLLILMLALKVVVLITTCYARTSSSGTASCWLLVSREPRCDASDLFRVVLPLAINIWEWSQCLLVDHIEQVLISWWSFLRLGSFKHPSWRCALNVDGIGIHFLKVLQVMACATTLEHPLFILLLIATVVTLQAIPASAKTTELSWQCPTLSVVKLLLNAILLKIIELQSPYPEGKLLFNFLRDEETLLITSAQVFLDVLKRIILLFLGVLLLFLLVAIFPLQLVKTYGWLLCNTVSYHEGAASKSTHIKAQYFRVVYLS